MATTSIAMATMQVAQVFGKTRLYRLVQRRIAPGLRQPEVGPLGQA